MDCMFVITYLVVLVSVNSVKVRQKTEELKLFSPVGRGWCDYKWCCVVLCCTVENLMIEMIKIPTVFCLHC